MKKVKNYIKSIKEYLEANGRYEAIDSFSLESLEKAYITLIKAEEDIDSRGILVKNRYNDLTANPSVKIANDSRVQINKLLENMSITHKLRYKDVKAEEEETPLEQFLKE